MGDAETAVIPIVGGPELVRPYVQSAEIVEPAVADPDSYPDAYPDGGHDPYAPGPYQQGGGGGAETTVFQPAGYEAGYGQGPFRPGGGGGDGAGGETVLLPAQRRSTELVRYQPGGRAVSRRAAASGASASGSGAKRRRALLIAAGALAVAGLGVAAAAVPSLLNGNRVDQAMPQPGVTAPLPTQTSDSASPAAAAQQSTASPSARPTASPSRVHHSARPSAPATPSTVRSTAPTSPTSPASSAPGTASATPSSAGGGQTLQQGDSGPAVMTMQEQLDNWISGYVYPDGVYGRKTTEAVASFQDQYGVQGDPSGVYGPNTQAELAALQSGGG
ncbi:peptidoglycan-binding protein [Streptacidiphilus sp. EB129]|uniref:peptidoglycan-binding domain-containing protein n=1 Tax=Streptacidiphilus sp. EB129 TaxID=3156262 RepID=UPI003515BACF